MKNLLGIVFILVIGFLLNTCALRKVLAPSKAVTTTATYDSIAILSWNIQDFGQTKNQEELSRIARILKPYDLIAIQEVVAGDGGVDAVNRLMNELNKQGDDYLYVLSEKTNSSSAYASERYAFIWKSDNLKLMGTPKLLAYLDKECDREPFQALFSPLRGIDTFSISTFHAVSAGKKPELEVVHLSEIIDSSQVKNILICGDFNLDEDHSAWSSLYEQGMKNVLDDQPTSLKRRCKNGVYLNHEFDNFFWTAERMSFGKGVVLDEVKQCEGLDGFRDLSDHLPIVTWLKFEVHPIHLDF
ncbi:endonuclease/exonuclease/phosphatase family protein [Lishizhenia sp.]|uniref:endonuclease/exonuclease/phosphatase family protein n=1 Tax=Lishizhenia sp. TaxID=2497594 RepID=UPI00299E07AB|nr:endonuclease/exonuclease/phosphatase family protein [Lishizhenia sp.]MDX1445021.1 endonuclease/exonuclease/phosphatase family protein [Lishizhenia sp.]